MAKDIVLAIDGTNRVHRLWHVTHDGEQCVRQFVRDLSTLTDYYCCPSAMVVAFDSQRCFRREIEPTYKLGRAAKEQGLIEALQRAFDEAGRGFPCIAVDQFEADDILATAAAVACYEGLRCVIASPDKDLRQCLIPDRVTILKGWKGIAHNFRPEYLTAAALEAEYGIGPDQWIDYQCLVGDATDGIRGADGIGDKTARKWLFEGGSIEAILGNRWLIPKMTERQWAALGELAKRLDTVRQLVTLRKDAPGVADLIRHQIHQEV
jgi:DNA polymerase-1